MCCRETSQAHLLKKLLQADVKQRSIRSELDDARQLSTLELFCTAISPPFAPTLCAGSDRRLTNEKAQSPNTDEGTLNMVEARSSVPSPGADGNADECVSLEEHVNLSFRDGLGVW